MRVLSSSRLLSFVNEHFPFSTKDLRWSIEHGRCFVNGSIERFCSTRLKKGDLINFWPVQRPIFIKEEARVLYEDSEFLAYNKPPFIASSDLAKKYGLHLVHRLDRDTTGVILFAKKNPARFEELFRKREMHKTYHAFVSGSPPQIGSYKGKIGKIGGRKGAVIWGPTPKGVFSQTDWVCEQQGKAFSLVRLHPLTGRTHQIRVHMKEIGHAVLGDCEYGSRKGREGIFRPLLHASELKFETFCLKAPLPKDFLHLSI